MQQSAPPLTDMLMTTFALEAVWRLTFLAGHLWRTETMTGVRFGEDHR